MTLFHVLFINQPLPKYLYLFHYQIAYLRNAAHFVDRSPVIYYGFEKVYYLGVRLHLDSLLENPRAQLVTPRHCFDIQHFLLL